MAVPPGPAAALVLGVFGLLVGSFANVVIYRVPEGRSIVKPPRGAHFVAAVFGPLTIFR